MSTIDLGKIRFEWKGNFDATVDYEVYDVVRYNSNVYNFIADHPAGAWDASHVNIMVTGESPITTQGDLAIGDSAGEPTRLPVSTTANKLLLSTGTTVDYSSNKIIGNKILLNRYEGNYTGGVINETTGYTWIGGLYHDYTPVSATSKIRVFMQFQKALYSGSGMISHHKFYWGSDQGLGTGAAGNFVEVVNKRFATSGYSVPEHMVSFEHTGDSWGTVEGRIGITNRCYSTSYYGRFHGTYYWDGTSSAQFHKPIFVIEEYEEE